MKDTCIECLAKQVKDFKKVSLEITKIPSFFKSKSKKKCIAYAKKQIKYWQDFIQLLN